MTNWTNELPSEPGWYWWRRNRVKFPLRAGALPLPAYPTIPVEVQLEDGDGLVAVGYSPLREFARKNGGQWSTKIPEPEEA